MRLLRDCDARGFGRRARGVRRGESGRRNAAGSMQSDASATPARLAMTATEVRASATKRADAAQAEIAINRTGSEAGRKSGSDVIVSGVKMAERGGSVTSEAEVGRRLRAGS